MWFEEIRRYVVITLAMLVINPVMADFSGKGSGTSDDPYQITNAIELYQVRNNPSSSFILMNDIDLTDWITDNNPEGGWIAIGTSKDDAFQGKFDGNGHCVKLMSNGTKSTTHAGFFGVTLQAYIHDLTIKGDYTDNKAIGGISCIDYGSTFLNCTFEGRIYSTINSGGTKLDVGGIVGLSANYTLTDTHIDNCIVHADIIGSSYYDDPQFSTTRRDSYTAGILGHSYQHAYITGCSVRGNITGAYACGIAGVQENQNVIPKNCYFEGTISGVIANAIMYSLLDQSIPVNCISRAKLITASKTAYGLSMKNCSNCVSLHEEIELEDNGKYYTGNLTNNLVLHPKKVTVNGEEQNTSTMGNIGEGMLKMGITYANLGFDMDKIWGIHEGESFPYLLIDPVKEPGINPGDDDSPVDDPEQLNNTLVISDIEVSSGGQVVLPIGMNNEDEVTAFSAYLYLPEGVTLASDESGWLVLLGSRTSARKHTISCIPQDNGAFLISVSSLMNAAFSDNQGDVAYITLNVDSELKEGNYSIVLKDIQIIGKSGSVYKIGKLKAMLNTVIYSLGDVDGNGKTNINDAICIVNHVLNLPNDFFIEKAADLDDSGSITLSDVGILIKDYILGANSSANTGATTYSQNDRLYIEDFAMKAGETHKVEVKMQTDRTDVKALQCDIYLPEGLEFVCEEEDGEKYYANISDRSDRSCAILASLQTDGALRIAEISQASIPFKQNSMALFYFTIKAKDNLADDSNCIIRLANGELSYGIGISIPEQTATLTIGSQQQSSPLGDLNGDGLVNAADIVKLVDIIMNK